MGKLSELSIDRQGFKGSFQHIGPACAPADAADGFVDEALLMTAASAQETFPGRGSHLDMSPALAGRTIGIPQKAFDPSGPTAAGAVHGHTGLFC